MIPNEDFKQYNYDTLMAMMAETKRRSGPFSKLFLWLSSRELRKSAEAQSGNHADVFYRSLERGLGANVRVLMRDSYLPVIGSPYVHDALEGSPESLAALDDVAKQDFAIWKPILSADAQTIDAGVREAYPDQKRITDLISMREERIGDMLAGMEKVQPATAEGSRVYAEARKAVIASQLEAFYLLP